MIANIVANEGLMKYVHSRVKAGEIWPILRRCLEISELWAVALSIQVLELNDVTVSTLCQ
jgi:hypothetical protein